MAVPPNHNLICRCCLLTILVLLHKRKGHGEEYNLRIGGGNPNHLLFRPRAAA